MDAKLPALGLVTSLVAELRDADVGFCHWKSTTGLPAALMGVGDLDLLVERAHARRFHEVSARLGFAPTVLLRGVHAPGVEHLHGLDDVTGRLVHLHVHHQLVLGHDATKNHRLPLERLFLDTADTTGTIPVPPPELEYAVLVLRMMLKYALVDEVVWRGLRGRVAGPTASERHELADLGDRASQAALDRLVVDEMRFLPPGLFDRCEDAVRSGVPLLRRLRLGRQLRRALAPHARHGAAVAAARRVGRRVEVAGLRRTGRMPRFGFGTGGAVVAVIGGDGAGKSTAVEAVRSSLGDEFDLHVVHLGRPPWSLTTTVVRGVLRIVAAVVRVRGEEVSPRIDAAHGTAFVQWRAALWHVCTARDRHRAYRRARRLANVGSLVLTDRYPHENLREMDVPQIRRSGLADGPLARLAAVEERYHDRIPRPDLLIVLRLDPRTAVARKTDEPAAYVQRRSTEVWTADWSGPGVHVVDAQRPVEEVVEEVRTLLWTQLR